MKILLSLSLLFISITSFSAEIDCIFETQGTVESKSIIPHIIGQGAHHMTPVNTKLTTGFIADYKGYLTVALRSKETNQPFSFFGDISNGGSVGGIFYSVDESHWTRVVCQQ
ncbi:MAG: hypothetical protein KC478_11240 [Bacteriovoracaceae bacterium]|nr:hypothetical protein [Bacteriovoracaceae bacterium]